MIKKQGGVDVSVVIPAYNEASTIESTVHLVSTTLNDITKNYEILIAEDGSTDGTACIAERLVKKYRGRVRHIHSKKRLGRGLALENALKASKGPIVAYMDSDLATDLRHLKEIILVIRNGADIATGSRYATGAVTKRRPVRLVASLAFNAFVRLILGSKLRDHQCGFKAFRKSSIMKLLDSVEDKHWFWDTEVLVRAQWAGLKVVEIPVRWHYTQATKVNVVDDSKYMGLRILRLWRARFRKKNSC